MSQTLTHSSIQSVVCPPFLSNLSSHFHVLSPMIVDNTQTLTLIRGTTTWDPIFRRQTDIKCDNNTTETWTHILRDCPRYAHHHKILLKASKTLSMPVLLGSKVGIEALSDFLIKSRAFSRTGRVLTAPSPPLLENEPDPNPVWLSVCRNIITGIWFHFNLVYMYF